MTFDLLAKLIVLFVWLLICGIISKVGNKRRIGSFYSFFISATISPIIGLIATLYSPSLKSHKAYLENTSTRKIFGIIFYCLGGLIIIAAIYTYYTSEDLYEVNYWPKIISSLGFLILGEYLYHYPIPTQEEIEIMMPNTDKEKIKSQWNFNEKTSSKFHINTSLVKKLFFLIAAIFILFVITNPSSKNFKEFIGTKDDTQIRRLSNWGIFSIHQDKHNNDRYIGIFLNFYKIE